MIPTQIQIGSLLIAFILLWLWAFTIEIRLKKIEQR